MQKTAIVTGITGQDGPYLSRYLVDMGYKVYGIIQRYSNPNFENIEYLNLMNDIDMITGDVTDDASMNHIIKSIKPNEFYNLAAQSFVGASWTLSKNTTEVNAVGVLNILNSILSQSSATKFYQASTSELFGNSHNKGIQDENTPFKPRSPYGVAKLYGYWITVNYRESYSLFTSNGILFNHESPLRGKEFVTRKVTDGVARIKLGLADKITLGNLEAKRDWGFAGDFVEAMHAMLQQEIPDDYIVCTGVQHSIKDLLNVAFRAIDITDWEKYVVSDPRFKRPAEVESLLGVNARAKEKLGWQPKTSFDDMINLMVQEDLKRLS